MKKIYTVRDVDRQRTHLWEGHLIEQEVSACSDRSIVPYFLELLPKEDEILEAGCGLGAWVVFLHKKGYRISGIDNNGEVIERLRQWDPGLRVSSGDIAGLPWPDGSLGAYISLGVVEHFEEGTERPLREAFRVLKRGGYLFLTVPSNNLFRRMIAHPLRSVYLLAHRLLGRDIHFAEYRYSPAEVRSMAETAGFTVVLTSTDDFVSKTRSLTLWSEFPFLRGGSDSYSLNAAGRALAWLLNTLSREILSSGVLVIAKKP
jgi:SAM-dependent methyltransferase